MLKQKVNCLTHRPRVSQSTQTLEKILKIKLNPIPSTCKPNPKHTLLHNRLKDNLLKSRLLLRKSRLETLYHQNQQIYQKITNKKSPYNGKDLNKSYSSLNSSRSKNKNSSFCTQKSNTSRNTTRHKPHKSELIPKPKPHFTIVKADHFPDKVVSELRSMFSTTLRPSNKENLPQLKTHSTEKRSTLV